MHAQSELVTQTLLQTCLYRPSLLSANVCQIIVWDQWHTRPYRLSVPLHHLFVSIPRLDRCRLAKHLQTSYKPHAHAAQSSRSNNHVAQQLGCMRLAYKGLKCKN